MNRMVQIILAVLVIVGLAIFVRAGGAGDRSGGSRGSDAASATKLATSAGAEQSPDVGISNSNGDDSSSVSYLADGAHSPDSQPGRRSAAPIESFLIGKSGLRADAAQDVVSTSKFDLLFAKMQQGIDANSLEQTELYRSSMQNTLASDKRFSVERIVCGHQLCAAEIVATGPDEKEISQLLMNDANNNPRRYALVQAMAEKPDLLNHYAFRMIFTTDPKLNSIEATYHP